MLENGMILGGAITYDSLPHDRDELIVDWDGRLIQPEEQYIGVWDQYQGITVLILDEPDQILSWLDSTKYEYDKPEFIKQYSEFDTSSVIDDMMTCGWFIKNDETQSDLDFFERYANIQFREIVED